MKKREVAKNGMNKTFVFLVAHKFGGVKFWLQNICCWFFQSELAWWKQQQIFKIHHVEIDEQQETLETKKRHICFHQKIMNVYSVYIILISECLSSSSNLIIWSIKCFESREQP